MANKNSAGFCRGEFKKFVVAEYGFNPDFETNSKHDQQFQNRGISGITKVLINVSLNIFEIFIRWRTKFWCMNVEAKLKILFGESGARK